jgi:hypothetical protein
VFYERNFCQDKSKKGRNKNKPTDDVIKVLYMACSFWLLGVESRDFSHAEKERTACKAE